MAGLWVRRGGEPLQGGGQHGGEEDKTRSTTILEEVPDGTTFESDVQILTKNNSAALSRIPGVIQRRPALLALLGGTSCSLLKGMMPLPDVAEDPAGERAALLEEAPKKDGENEEEDEDVGAEKTAKTVWGRSVCIIIAVLSLAVVGLGSVLLIGLVVRRNHNHDPPWDNLPDKKPSILPAVLLPSIPPTPPSKVVVPPISAVPPPSPHPPPPGPAGGGSPGGPAASPAPGRAPSPAPGRTPSLAPTVVPSPEGNHASPPSRGVPPLPSRTPPVDEVVVPPSPPAATNTPSGGLLGGSSVPPSGTTSFSTLPKETPVQQTEVAARPLATAPPATTTRPTTHDRIGAPTSSPVAVNVVPQPTTSGADTRGVPQSLTLLQDPPPAPIPEPATHASSGGPSELPPAMEIPSVSAQPTSSGGGGLLRDPRLAPEPATHDAPSGPLSALPATLETHPPLAEVACASEGVGCGVLTPSPLLEGGFSPANLPLSTLVEVFSRADETTVVAPTDTTGAPAAKGSPFAVPSGNPDPSQVVSPETSGAGSWQSSAPSGQGLRGQRGDNDDLGPGGRAGWASAPQDLGPGGPPRCFRGIPQCLGPGGPPRTKGMGLHEDGGGDNDEEQGGPEHGAFMAPRAPPALDGTTATAEASPAPNSSAATAPEVVGGSRRHPKNQNYRDPAWEFNKMEKLPKDPLPVYNTLEAQIEAQTLHQVILRGRETIVEDMAKQATPFAPAEQGGAGEKTTEEATVVSDANQTPFVAKLGGLVLQGMKINFDSPQFSWASWIALFCYHLTEANFEKKMIQPTAVGWDKKELRFVDVIGRNLDEKLGEDGVLTYTEAVVGTSAGNKGGPWCAYAQKDVARDNIPGRDPSDQEYTVKIDLRFRNREKGSIPVLLQDLKKAMDVLAERRLVKGPAPEREKVERTPWNSVIDSSSSEGENPNSAAALATPRVGAERRFPNANGAIRAIEVRRKRGIKRFVPHKGKVVDRLREWWWQVRVALPGRKGWAFVWTIIPDGTDEDVLEAFWPIIPGSEPDQEPSSVGVEPDQEPSSGSAAPARLKPREKEPENEPRPLKKDDAIVLAGLTQANFNGLHGRLLFFDEKTGRWAVQLTSSAKNITLKAENIERIDTGLAAVKNARQRCIPRV